jgi:hypothetical protein
MLRATPKYHVERGGCTHPTAFSLTTKTRKNETTKNGAFADNPLFFRHFVLSRFRGQISFGLAL